MTFASTAHHEAGHAVVARLCGLEVTDLLIITGDDSDMAGVVTAPILPAASVLADGYGYTLTDEDLVAAYTWIEARVLTSLAGVIAEEMFTGAFDMDGASADMAQISDIVKYAFVEPDERSEREPDLELAPVFMEGGHYDSMTDKELEKWLDSMDDEELEQHIDSLDDIIGVVYRAFDRWGDECRELLEANWAWVKAVAQAALRPRTAGSSWGTLSGAEIDLLRPMPAAGVILE